MSSANVSVSEWTNEQDETTILDSISIDEPWAAVEKLSTLVRLSGTSEEREAISYLTSRLDSFGVDYTLHEPVCFISIPRGASVRIDSPEGESFRAKTVSMSASTDGKEITGELVYLPSSGGRGTGIDIFSTGMDSGDADLTGKIIISEGMAAPGKVRDAMKLGAIAGIFINPGEYIHEGICTTIWGAPDLDNMERQPTIPAINVNFPDGQKLIEHAKQGGSVAISTTLELDWRPIPVLVAEVKGSQVPDEFVLVHGHLDGWHYGVADNATGDASLLEMARVFQANKDKLARSVRIAWWSGHSHGRYAGATWYADTFGIDLAKNCIAQVNCDSPGARWADTYNNLTCMDEAETFVDKVIRETTGIIPQPDRPPRAGDYAFNSIGVTSFYMLSSTMSDEKRAEEGYYPVGGCGGNIQWHTEDDLLDIADRDNLLRDIKMYAASVYRTANAPLHPFDWTITTGKFRELLNDFQSAAGEDFNFRQSREALDALDSALKRFYEAAPRSASASDSAARAFNHAQRRLGRLLVRVNYSRMPEFWHDPAVTVPPLPDLQPARTIPDIRSDEHMLRVTRSHLTRGQNRLVWALEQAREVVDAATK